jgi:Cof subfamily protein (haloacid dehalogenase superfamily)
MGRIKMVAVDMDGTFCRSDHSFDEVRFRRILDRMDAVGCRFVVASGNQYFQLRDFFVGYDERLAFVAENGAYVKDRDELLFAGEIDRATVEATLGWIDAWPDVANVMSCLDCAYVERGRASERFFEIMGTYYHRLAWADSLRAVDEPVLKFALAVPEAETYAYLDRIKASLSGGLEPTTSGHGAIDLIVPGCHKASGLARLAERWGVDPADAIAFGDGGNDVEMLRYVGCGYAMANASDELRAVADATCPSNDEDGVLEVLDSLF